MPRPRALPATAALVVATGLTLGAAGALDLIERPVRDVPVLQWLAPDRPETDPDRVAGAGAVVPPGPTPGTLRGPASGPAPDLSANGRTGPHARIRTTPGPVLLHIESLGVSASVVTVGVLPEGGMEVPDDVRLVGWYATDARRVSPGDPGTAVIAGHRDSRTQGAGALHDLAELRRGDTIDVVHLDGLVSRWVVQGVLTTPRDALPSEMLFRRDGDPLLALVTCGGTFDRVTRSYSHNTIVLATLADG
jgi:hypothetical protein